ncbi:hypothetical protein NEF87_000673 [Candidatus Lokiarchaeum ossiferum]|uniref:PGF-CTERM sorting domain-containing protein n=1 Tax=Candidatus Lokiarchaeum ossiferum TaxID=2951803 RepID=A0ABY6HM55_9ARCH|nr:hypothetical protein NEF87_000673 [Candidatus Lokiarchaeum sp. B-35]
MKKKQIYSLFLVFVFLGSISFVQGFEGSSDYSTSSREIIEEIELSGLNFTYPFSAGDEFIFDFNLAVDVGTDDPTIYSEIDQWILDNSDIFSSFDIESRIEEFEDLVYQDFDIKILIDQMKSIYENRTRFDGEFYYNYTEGDEDLLVGEEIYGQNSDIKAYDLIMGNISVRNDTYWFGAPSDYALDVINEAGNLISNVIPFDRELNEMQEQIDFLSLMLPQVPTNSLPIEMLRFRNLTDEFSYEKWDPTVPTMPTLGDDDYDYKMNYYHGYHDAGYDWGYGDGVHDDEYRDWDVFHQDEKKNDDKYDDRDHWEESFYPFEDNFYGDGYNEGYRHGYNHGYVDGYEDYQTYLSTHPQPELPFPDYFDGLEGFPLIAPPGMNFSKIYDLAFEMIDWENAYAAYLGDEGLPIDDIWGTIDDLGAVSNFYVDTNTVSLVINTDHLNWSFIEFLSKGMINKTIIEDMVGIKDFTGQINIALEMNEDRTFKGFTMYLFGDITLDFTDLQDMLPDDDDFPDFIRNLADDTFYMGLNFSLTSHDYLPPSLNDMDPDEFLKVANLGEDSDDYDNDGILNSEEIAAGSDTYITNEYSADTDGDFLLDAEEIALGLDPTDADSDGDSMPDGWEVYYGTDPETDDSSVNTDGDGFTNLEEYDHMTDPGLADTDGDGLNDDLEILSDPLNPDTDGDDLNDYDEIIVYFTNPLNEDTDNDNMTDGWEVSYGLNATLTADGKYNNDTDDLLNDEEFARGCSPLTNDTDNDDLDDRFEIEYPDHALSPSNNDTDWDGLSDYDEVMTYFTKPNRYDTDNDGLDDYEELFVYFTNATYYDTDYDEMNDWEEVRFGINPNNVDSDGDLIPDGYEWRHYNDDWHHLDPSTADDTSVDWDGDGLTLLQEIVGDYSDPEDWDTDRDGLDDYEESVLNTDPRDWDTDHDGLSDSEEHYNAFTDPKDWDSENDLMPDGWEWHHGLDPNTDDAADDLDADGRSNLDEYYDDTWPNDPDTDKDGLSDGDEALEYTDPRDWDSDNDGLSDGFENTTTGYEPLTWDSVTPGIPDYESMYHSSGYSEIVTLFNTHNIDYLYEDEYFGDVIKFEHPGNNARWFEIYLFGDDTAGATFTLSVSYEEEVWDGDHWERHQRTDELYTDEPWTTGTLLTIDSHNYGQNWYNFKLMVFDGNPSHDVEEYFDLNVKSHDPMVEGPNDETIDIFDSDSYAWFGWNIHDNMDWYEYGNYVITRGTSIVKRGNWYAGDFVGFDVCEVPPIGVWEFTIHVDDNKGGHSVRNLTLNIEGVDPTISHPADITIDSTVAAADAKIHWTIEDPSVQDGAYYEIFVDSISIREVMWNGEQQFQYNITEDLSTLSAGVYEYKIVADDGRGGIVDDIVIVTVNAPANTTTTETTTTETTTPPFEIPGYSPVVFGFVSLIAIAYIIKKRK